MPQLGYQIFLLPGLLRFQILNLILSAVLLQLKHLRHLLIRCQLLRYVFEHIFRIQQSILLRPFFFKLPFAFLPFCPQLGLVFSFGN